MPGLFFILFPLYITFMEVILADVLGYCFGVRRAVDTATLTLENNNGNKVYSLGPLIHNQVALEMLSEKGLCVLKDDNLENVEAESKIIIRAHGVPPETLKKIEENKCEVINATCPKVLASQKSAAKYAAMGYTVILAGDRNHGEVVGIAGYAGKKFILIENCSDAEKLPLFSADENVVLLSQTTFSREEFKGISEILQKKAQNLKVMDTICSATRERQKALEALCPKVDGVLVVGGKNSANTKRLFQIARTNCKHAAFIETADEIPEEYYLLDKVGITAGASTPDSVIQSVVARLTKK